MFKTPWSFAAAVCLALSGCECSNDTTDSGIDAGRDAGPGPGLDAGMDSGVDAGVDAGIDAGTDAGADAGADAGEDAGVDAGGGEGGGMDAGCVRDPDGGLIFPDAGALCVSTGRISYNLYYSRAPTDAGQPETIWVRSANGLREVLITTGSRPTVSRDGRLLAFTRDSTTGNGSAAGARGDVWVRELDTGVERKLFTNNDYVVFGSFTPDAGTYVFDYQCSLTQVLTSGATPATGFPGWGGCYTDQPAVSPDGTQVAVRNLFNGLGVEDFTGTNQRWILPASAGVSAYPRWSPNQAWIAYLLGSTDDGTGQLRALHPDGGGDQPLSTNDVCGAPLVVTGPGVFTPDGDWVVAAGTSQGVNALWALGGDGNGDVLRLCVSPGPPVTFCGGVGPLPVDAGQ